jgi:hypothetical protein
MRRASTGTAQAVAWFTVGVGVIFALVTAIGHVHGWLWTALRVANAVVFVLAVLILLAGWLRARQTHAKL